MWKPNSQFFSVDPPKQIGWVRDPAPQQQQASRPEIADDESKKQLYGIELAKVKDISLDAAFRAALIVFADDVPISLWVANHWTTDPLVIASRDLYAKTLKSSQKLLDKEELAAKALEWAEEKVERNGRAYYVNELKDRTAALKLYAEIAGYIGKIAIDASTNSFTNNEMKIVLVKPDKQEQKIIESKIENEVIEENFESPIKIKLVS